MKVFNDFGQNKNKFDLAFGLNNVCKQNNLQVEIDVCFDTRHRSGDLCKISRDPVASTKILGFTLHRFFALGPLLQKVIRLMVSTFTRGIAH